MICTGVKSLQGRGGMAAKVNAAIKAVSEEPSDPSTEEEEIKQELPVVPAPIQEDDLLPIPEAP